MSGLITSGKAARKLGIGREKLRRWAELGFVPSIVDPESGYRHFSEPALDEWLRSNGTHAVDRDPTPPHGLTRPEAS